LQELAVASQRITASLDIFCRLVETGRDRRGNKLETRHIGSSQNILRQGTGLPQLLLDQVPDAVGDTRGHRFQITLQAPAAALHADAPLPYQFLDHSDQEKRIAIGTLVQDAGHLHRECGRLKALCQIGNNGRLLEIRQVQLDTLSVTLQLLTMSCAMCHVPEQGFTVNELAQAVGVEGRSLRRNSPTLLNVAYMRALFHDGRETCLETQVLGPLLSRDEMANPSMGYLAVKINRLDDYAGLFEQAFQRDPSVETIGQAIASYERALLAANSSFDRWYYGKQRDALSSQAQAGFRLFMGKAQCVACHPITDQAALLTDQAFHNTGLGWYNSMACSQRAMPTRVELAPGIFTELAAEVIASVGDPPPPDLGRYEVTLLPADRWQYKTPSLRNLALTAPYMHDGSLSTLEEVVQFYNRGGYAHPFLDPAMRPLHLTDAEMAALVAFLESLMQTILPS
jgi:cytochrome c peroxidase